MGTLWCLTYCVARKTFSAIALRNPRPEMRPATGIIRNPEPARNVSLTSASCGTRVRSSDSASALSLHGAAARRSCSRVRFSHTARPGQRPRLGARPPRGRREALVQRRELFPHGAPDRFLFGRVRDARQGVALAVRERHAGDLVAARTVDRVAEAGMIGVEGNELPGARGDRRLRRGGGVARHGRRFSQAPILPPSQLLDESLALL